MRPGKREINSQQSDAGIAAQQKRVVDEQVRCIDGRAVTSAQSGLPDGDQHHRVPSGNANIRSGRAQTFPLHLAEFCWGKTALQILIFGWIYQIAKRLDIDRFNFSSESGAREKAADSVETVMPRITTRAKRSGDGEN